MQASADFESPDALTASPYIEGGLFFLRTNLSANPCGFTVCAGNPGFTGFSGNYMYGLGAIGIQGFFSIAAPSGHAFSNLEFLFGTGFAIGSGNANFASWEAFRNGASVGTGTFSETAVSVVGFSAPQGFDTLRITSSYAPGSVTQNAPAFDTVRAQFAPEPHSFVLLCVGLIGLAALRRSRSS